jgi:hypothetical protein
VNYVRRDDVAELLVDGDPASDDGRDGGRVEEPEAAVARGRAGEEVLRQRSIVLIEVLCVG